MKSCFWSGLLAGVMAACAGMASVSVAAAADLAVAPTYKAAPVYLSDWAGFYVGIHGGYGWGDTTFSGDRSFLDAKPQGGLGGVQAGYNWQFGRFVTGVEGDFSWANVDQSSAVNGFIFNSQGTFPESRDIKFDELATVRARLGYVIVPGVLAYATGGGAWGHSQTTVFGGPISVPATATGFGWAAGAGVEYKVFEHVMLRAEYLHYGFGSFSYDRGGNFTPEFVNGTTSIDVLRAGLSYKF